MFSMFILRYGRVMETMSDDRMFLRSIGHLHNSRAEKRHGPVGVWQETEENILLIPVSYANCKRDAKHIYHYNDFFSNHGINKNGFHLYSACFKQHRASIPMSSSPKKPLDSPFTQLFMGKTQMCWDELLHELVEFCSFRLMTTFHLVIVICTRALINRRIKFSSYKNKI